MGSASQSGPMRPQQPQQRPMGQQGKGPGLPMPQQPNMGGNRPYQPVGANNGPFHQNPVQPVNQPPQMPPQGKAPGQPMGDMPKPPGQNPLVNYARPGQPIPPGQIDPGYMPSAMMNPNTNFGSATSPLQPGQLPQGITPPMLQQAQQGKGPQSPFNTPAQAGPAQVQNNNPGSMQ